MNERVEDRVLAFMKRALETKPQPLVGGGMTTREALKIVEEVQQYRARAAAHAQTHPERLSEDELDLLRMSGDDLLDDAPLTHGRLVKAIAEIRQRRATDLTPPEVGRLEWLSRKLGDFIGDAFIRDPLCDLLERIIHAAR